MRKNYTRLSAILLKEEKVGTDKKRREPGRNGRGSGKFTSPCPLNPSPPHPIQGEDFA